MAGIYGRLMALIVQQSRATAGTVPPASVPAPPDLSDPLPTLPEAELLRPGVVLTHGVRPDYEAKHISKSHLADHLGHVVVTAARVPGVDIVDRAPFKYLGGAYRKDGTLVSESALWRRLARGMDCATMAYPSLPKATAQIPAGVFGGVLFPHFGHLLVESTARSWWLVEHEPTLPLVLQFQAGTDVIPKYAHQLFRLAGVGLHVVSKGGLSEVDRLVVPDPALVERMHGHPYFLKFFDRVRSAALTNPIKGEYGDLLFVARGAGVAQVFGEELVATELVRQGYRVLDPTATSLEEQIVAFSKATHIVGSIGSAMHNIVHAVRAQRVAYLVRQGAVSATFPAIDQACHRHEAHYFYVGLTPLMPHGQLDGPYLIDPELACHLLYENGFIQKRPEPSHCDVLGSRDAYMRDWAAKSTALKS